MEDKRRIQSRMDDVVRNLILHLHPSDKERLHHLADHCKMLHDDLCEAVLEFFGNESSLSGKEWDGIIVQRLGDIRNDLAVIVYLSASVRAATKRIDSN